MDMDIDGHGNLSLNASKFFLPKKSSKRPLGQDAFFISPSKQTVGVADGVGGVKSADSGVYARELMSKAREFVESHPAKSVDPMRVLQAAFVNSNSGGGAASTACIITLKRNSLHAVNLGDSGFMVIRGDKIVFKSRAQQHSLFNCPFQLGGRSRTMPRHADGTVIGVELGDVLVAGTDGLFDNLFDSEIKEVVKTAVQKGKSSAKVAALLGNAVKVKYGSMERCATPFSIAAAKNNYKHSGAKYDDVTIIVGYIY